MQNLDNNFQISEDVLNDEITNPIVTDLYHQMQNLENNYQISEDVLNDEITNPIVTDLFNKLCNWVTRREMS